MRRACRPGLWQQKDAAWICHEIKPSARQADTQVIFLTAGLAQGEAPRSLPARRRE